MLGAKLAEVGVGGEGLAAVTDFTGVWGVQGAEEAQKGGLATAGGAHDGDVFALLDGEVDTAEGEDLAVVELAADVVDFKQGGGGFGRGRHVGCGLTSLV